jgi:hypothetical protein
MAGKIPPLVIPSLGIDVRNSQLMTLMPLTAINARMTNSIPTTMKLITRKIENAINSEIFFDFTV